MRRIVDQGGEGVLIVLEQFFGRLLVLTYSSSERRICITGFVDKTTETDLKGFPSSSNASLIVSWSRSPF
ncbi:hypothetical protein L3X38_018808 [Prunus dulcis]|uniref:Uncharacterized protein n=1 Tax=Prunus dulcis TaxID=3755 RepID=A0AAD4WAF9_PRUDU|nr:hypothetical protein L3X38_018808 [Prunus dulcis]